MKEIQFLDWLPISLRLDLGQYGGISGPSGSGKSLLARAIADLIEFRGIVTWRGTSHDALPSPVWRQRVGLLPANPVWWHDRVGEHFINDVSEWLSDLGFGNDVLNWKIARMSSGEKQRLALVRLLDRRPECLILDEPTANLDAESGRLVEDLIRRYVSRNIGRTAVLLISHDEELLVRTCQYQWRMEERDLKPVRG